MLEFLSRIFGKDDNSRSAAKERLRLVLVHDRSSISPQVMEELKADLIQTISKYMEIDVEGLEVTLDREDTSVALVANIPIRQVKRRLRSANP